MPGFLSSISNDEDLVFANNADFTNSGNNPSIANGLQLDGQLWIGHTDVAVGAQNIYVGNIVGGTGITVGYSSPNITIASTAALTDLHVARFIVASSTSGTGANYTTITAAIAAAVATGINSTIFLQPGTYTENFNLPANINICAFDCDAVTPNVTINGTITMNTSGFATISGIRLQTNGASSIAVTGSTTSILVLKSCYLNFSISPGITFSSSDAGARITILDCIGDTNVSGATLFANSSSGVMTLSNSLFVNTGGSTTANTVSAGILNLTYSQIQNPLTISGTGSVNSQYSAFTNAALNTTMLTAGGSGSQSLKWCRFESGSASAISISTTATVEMCDVNSTNTNAITGAGTIQYGPITFSGSSSIINTSTQTFIYTNLGKYKASGQPAFLAYLSSNQNNVTGDGTAFHVPFDTVVFDQSSSFTTGASALFTAPVTGKYFFSATVYLFPSVGGISEQLSLIATSRTLFYRFDFPTTTNQAGFTVTGIIDMTAGDTAYVQIASVGGTKTGTVVGTGSPYQTYFSGYLVA
jgi:hypothetical protein